MSGAEFTVNEQRRRLTVVLAVLLVPATVALASVLYVSSDGARDSSRPVSGTSLSASPSHRSGLSGYGQVEGPDDAIGRASRGWVAVGTVIRSGGYDVLRPSAPGAEPIVYRPITIRIDEVLRGANELAGGDTATLRALGGESAGVVTKTDDDYSPELFAAGTQLLVFGGALKDLGHGSETTPNLMMIIKDGQAMIGDKAPHERFDYADIRTRIKRAWPNG